MNYRTPEQRREEEELAYHAACYQQYLDSANRFNGRMKQSAIQRMLDNAEFHRRHLEARGVVAVMPA